MALETVADYAVWALCAVSAYLGKKTLDNDRSLSALELKIEREFQRQTGLETMITKAVSIAIMPLSIEVRALDGKFSQAIDELDSQRKDMNTLLDKFEVPAGQRHG